MANKKDLQDAQNYSRARLITAFTSGMPDGKELTPKKGLTPVMVSIGLTAIMVLISVFYGIISPGLPSDWSNNKLIVGKDTASRFISVNGVLHPVINTTSARLLIPSDEYRVITVDDNELEGIPIGSSVGIVGAPDILPNRSRLVSKFLVSCLDTERASTNNLITNDAVTTPARGHVPRIIVAHIDRRPQASQAIRHLHAVMISVEGRGERCRSADDGQWGLFVRPPWTVAGRIQPHACGTARGFGRFPRGVPQERGMVEKSIV
ncbi:type VII secretion protein EccB [Bifidobacterium longum subsp. suis]|uniref:type VII secretion protein EccB n=1 Tax=Bifidobacterium longum TaxID=216816 RepID=UPI003CFF1D5E